MCVNVVDYLSHCFWWVHSTQTHLLIYHAQYNILIDIENGYILSSLKAKFLPFSLRNINFSSIRCFREQKTEKFNRFVYGRVKSHLLPKKTNIFSYNRSLRDLKPQFSPLNQTFLCVSFLNSYFLDFYLSLINPHFLLNFHFHEKGS